MKENKYTQKEIEVADILLCLFNKCTDFAKNSMNSPQNYISSPESSKNSVENSMYSLNTSDLSYLYKCTIDRCNFETNRKWNMTRHIRNLHKNKRIRKKRNLKNEYKCFTCEYQFTSWINLARHSSVHCDKNEPLFKCECGWITNISEDLQIHKELVHD